MLHVRFGNELCIFRLASSNEYSFFSKSFPSGFSCCECLWMYCWSSIRPSTVHCATNWSDADREWDWVCVAHSLKSTSVLWLLKPARRKFINECFSMNIVNTKGCTNLFTYLLSQRKIAAEICDYAVKTLMFVRYVSYLRLTSNNDENENALQCINRIGHNPIIIRATKRPW